MNNQLNFDSFIIKYQNPEDINKVDDIFFKVLNYSFIIDYQEVEFIFPIYSTFWIKENIIYQKDIFEELYLDEYLKKQQACFYHQILDVNNKKELESFIKRIKYSFIDPRTLYLPKILQID